MPVPQNTEAAAIIADKPLLAAAIADTLSPQLRARVFAIAGVHHFNTLAQIRAEIAALLAGGEFGQDGPGTPPTWDTSRKAIAEALQAATGTDNATARADRIIRLHTSQALAAQREAEHAAMVDIFPWKQYLSMEDGRVRPAHVALEGLILPCDAPFWRTHTPPWEWGCRCQTAPISDFDKEDYEKRHPERVITDPANSTYKGISVPNPYFDGTQPEDKHNPRNLDIIPRGSWHFDWRDMTADIRELAKTWDGQTQMEFEGWANETILPDRQIDGHAATLRDWLAGKALTPVPDASAMRETMLHSILPGLHTAKPLGPKRILATGHTPPPRMAEALEGALKFVPDSLVDELLPLRISIENDLGALGKHKNGHIRINSLLIPPEDVKTLYHEVGHWLLKRPQAVPQKEALANLYDQTIGDMRTVKRHRQGWYYCGDDHNSMRIYPPPNIVAQLEKGDDVSVPRDKAALLDWQAGEELFTIAMECLADESGVDCVANPAYRDILKLVLTP